MTVIKDEDFDGEEEKARKEDDIAPDEISDENQPPDERGEPGIDTPYQKVLRRISDSNKHYIKFEGEHIKLDSTLELMRFRYLNLLYQNGLIRNLKPHKKYELIRSNEDHYGMTFTPDFDYDAPLELTDGALRWTHITEDVKSAGSYVEASRIKHKLFRHIHGWCITVVRFDEYKNQFTTYQGKEDTTEDYQFVYLDSLWARLIRGEDVRMGVHIGVLRPRPQVERVFKYYTYNQQKFSLHMAFFPDGRKRPYQLKEDESILQVESRLSIEGHTHTAPVSSAEYVEWFQMRKMQDEKNLPSLPVHSEWNPETRVPVNEWPPKGYNPKGF